MKNNLLFSLLLIPFFCPAQYRGWMNSYNSTTNADDCAFAVVVDGSGNSYITGYSEGPTSLAFATIKYNSSGAQQWISFYDPTPSTDFAQDIAIDGGGNLLVTGITGGPDYNFGIVKYSNSGAQLWAQQFDGGYGIEDQGTAITTDNSGNVYATGMATTPSGNINIATVKYSSAGTFLWSAFFNGTNDSADWGYDVAVDGSGNVYVLGQTSGTGQGMNYVIIKYNSSGAQQWATEINGSGNQFDEPQAMVLDASGNIYVTGTLYAAGEVSNCGTAKLNSSGSIVWKTEYHGTGGNADYSNDIALDAAGNVYITGTSVAFTSGFYDAITIKYDNNGNQIWAREYDGLGGAADRGNAIALDAAGNVFVTGQSNKPVGAPKKEDYLTIKYDNSGTLLWGDEYDGSASDNDYAFDIAVDPAGNAIVTGWVSGAGESYNMFTVKYCTTPASVSPISGDDAVCAGEGGVTYSVTSPPGATNYIWTVPIGATITSGAGTNTITVQYSSSAGSGAITVQAENSCHIGPPSPPYTVTVSPVPSVPVITQSGTTLTSSATSGNQWYLNGTIIPGATAQTYTATTSGNYTVVVTGSNGCSSESPIFAYSTGITETAIDLSRQIYPNPAAGIYTVRLPSFEKYGLTVRNLQGELIPARIQRGIDGNTIDISGAANGIYILEMRSAGTCYRGILAKQ